MKRLTALILAALLLIGASALAEGATLTVQGTGVVSMAPDTATITFGVKRIGPDISKSQIEVNEMLGKVIDRLREMGMTDEDIATSSINIYETYSEDSYSASSIDGDYQQRTIYAVENSVSVTIHDIDHAGSYIDAVFEAGANTFTNIEFSASDSSAQKERAMALAMENARARAQVLADAAGMKVGEVLSITDGGSSNYYYGDDAVMEKAAVDTGAGFANMVFTSDLQISATVTVVYALLPVEE